MEKEKKKLGKEYFMLVTEINSAKWECIYITERTKKIQHSPLLIQPYWFQDGWNKLQVYLDDWAHDLFQWLVQPLCKKI